MLGAIGAIVLLATWTPINSWWIERLDGEWENPKGEWMVLLGGDAVDNKTLGEMSFWRCVYASWLWRSGQFRHVIISGGNRPETALLTAPMTDYLVTHGVPREAIIIEPQSRSTRENAVYTAPLLPMGLRPVLVTSDFHMLRARKAFRKVGVDVAPFPVPDAVKQNNNWRNRWTVTLALAEETAKIAWYRWQGWI